MALSLLLSVMVGDSQEYMVTNIGAAGEVHA